MFRYHWADWKKIHWVLRVKSMLTLLFNYSQWIKSSKSWGSENKLSFTLKSWILLNQAKILNFTPFVSQQTRWVKAPSYRRLFSDMKLVFVCLNLFCLLRITGAIKAQTWILRPILMNSSVHESPTPVTTSFTNIPISSFHLWSVKLHILYVNIHISQ